MKLQTVFFGSADISVPTLRGLSAADWCDVVAVVTQADKPVGRKHALTPTPVKIVAQELGLPVFYSVTELPADSYDLGVLVAYGTILKQPVIDMFTHGIVNMHPSLLPRWRGPAPIQYALLNNEAETGISIMLIDKGMDTGPLIAQEAVQLQGHETASQLHDSMAESGAQLLLKAVPDYVSGEIVPQEQQGEPTYAKLIKREDGQLRASDSPQAMYAKYRAFHPWPGVFLVWQGKRYKVLEATLQDGAFMITTIQPAGKQAMSFEQFLNGHREFALTDISNETV